MFILRNKRWNDTINIFLSLFSSGIKILIASIIGIILLYSILTCITYLINQLPSYFYIT